QSQSTRVVTLRRLLNSAPRRCNLAITPEPGLDVRGSRHTATLDVDPKAYVRFYGTVAPYLALHARGQLDLEYPWQPADPEVLLTVSGSAGLEIDLLFRQLDLKVDPLFEWNREWDLWGPSGLPSNQPPVATATTATSPPAGMTIALQGSDPDDDPITFAIADHPTHGVLGLIDPATGRVPYYPTGGYRGTDSFRFLVTDGRLNSNEAEVAITVAEGNPPSAHFAASLVHPTVYVDASTSSDPEDPESALEVRWDWTNDGVWDTDWTTTKTANHSYGQAGSYVIRLLVRDSSGMQSTATRTINLTSSGQQGWSQLSAAGPPARMQHAMVFDELRERIVMFGGSNGSPLGDTWEWDGSTWSQKNVNGPGARLEHAMSYDSLRGKTLLFGGSNGSYLGDTWEWDGSTWSQVNAGTSGLHPRDRHAMVFDGTRGKTVLYGGYVPGVGGFDDTWEWNGSSWTQVGVGGPGHIHSHCMAFDAARSVTMLFGGVDNSGTSYSASWTWNGSGWRQLAATGPDPTHNNAMAYDGNRARVVMFGGYKPGLGSLRTTWEWNGASWSLESNEGPSDRGNHAMCFDSTRDQVVLFGGAHASGTLGDTWAWGGQ
ncbi:MAG: hypothetical protein KDC98_08780, partial [Planctomycetes bacterium]|nr:hypothetical protein [Planctomycetota bacterium]